MAELDRTPDQLGQPPSWIERMTSSADSRAGSNARSARSSAELDPSSSGDGRAGTIALFSSCPQCSSRKTVLKSLLFRIDQSCHWSFIIRTVRIRLPEYSSCCSYKWRRLTWHHTRLTIREIWTSLANRCRVNKRSFEEIVKKNT